MDQIIDIICPCNPLQILQHILWVSEIAGENKDV